MRNIVAHKYDSLDLEGTWDTAQEDIPALREYCQQMLSELERDLQ